MNKSKKILLIILLLAFFFIPIGVFGFNLVFILFPLVIFGAGSLIYFSSRIIIELCKKLINRDKILNKGEFMEEQIKPKVDQRNLIYKKEDQQKKERNVFIIQQIILGIGVLLISLRFLFPVENYYLPLRWFPTLSHALGIGVLTIGLFFILERIRKR